jgi:hypothetical protein
LKRAPANAVKSIPTSPIGHPLTLESVKAKIDPLQCASCQPPLTLVDCKSAA